LLNKHMVTSAIITGISGGLVATVVMTALMMMLGDDSPPPTAQLWAKYVGDGHADDYMMQGMVLHMMYGIGAGVVFVVGLHFAGIPYDEIVNAVGFGVAYGILLTVVGAAFWMNMVLGVKPERKTAMMFGIFHLAYAVVLGAWTGLGVM